MSIGLPDRTHQHVALDDRARLHRLKGGVLSVKDPRRPGEPARVPAELLPAQLDHAAVGRQVAFEHHQVVPRRRQRFVKREDDVLQDHDRGSVTAT